ncbi:(2Fe-2S)-binding protein [Solimonas marina]|uniref:Bacterioferritin-associated ferredoxin n=1 Tax=Solimonas marina TaxID=2714601 RepID=A0A969W976_9GAMM|nr:(2Fe-2S)-binding protein [Solimonas marina]NKF20685.1 (2Fe-2S)-binding protein [Solimonas marina]
MFVCVCKAVSDRQIRRDIREEGVTSLRELARLRGVGTCCGKCVPQARRLLDETLEQHRAAVAPVPLAGLGGLQLA